MTRNQLSLMNLRRYSNKKSAIGLHNGSGLCEVKTQENVSSSIILYNVGVKSQQRRNFKCNVQNAGVKMLQPK